MFAIRRSRLVSLMYLGAIVGLAMFLPEAVFAQPYKAAVGYNQLATELGGSLETGAGVNVALVEASFGAANRYMPDTTNSQFSGKTILEGSGATNGNSSHALTVGQYYFGNSSSMAPGVTNISVFEAGSWINSRLAPGGGGTPLTENFRVSNHSYVARTADVSEANAVNYLMRMDYYINQSGTTVVVGTDNDTTVLPRLFTQGYNSISVGLSTQSTKNFSRGFTNLYGNGRVKPDIVVSLNEGTGMDYTSFSTAIVSSAATLLHAKADTLGANAADARRPEVIKSILMSGATKEAGMNWDRTNTRPLDETYGAGQLNIRNSYYTMQGGQFNGHLSTPTSQIGLNGWDYESSLAGNTSMFYEFAVGSGGVQDISMMLNWNIQVTDTDAGANFLPAATLSNLSLSLLDSSNNVIDFSNSPVDNLEHISLSSLNSGTYRMRVDNLSSFSSSFALSWRMTAVPEPGSGGVLLLFTMGMLARRGRRPRV
ncbi:MAG: hypothetical protein JNL67_01130 [Planctomycetaceae bacterium]|nr:hypothetical protein [Planctomycetaceae bacterium]